MSGKGRVLGDESWPALSLCESVSQRERRGRLPASGEQCEPLRHSPASSGRVKGNTGTKARLAKEMDDKTLPSYRRGVPQEPTGFDRVQPHLAPTMV